MGFSKGCAVLNQFLYEFHYYDENSNSDSNTRNFIRLIKDMWWLDGGHNGPKNTWITDQNILRSFAKLSEIIRQTNIRQKFLQVLFSILKMFYICISTGINTHVHVTPYQMQDFHRPWIHVEEGGFNATLKKLGVPVQRTLHFADRERSLSSHFNVLTEVKSNVG